MKHRIRDVGGTPGGLPLFGLGLGMAAGGAYLLTNQVSVHSCYWGFWGQQTFGLTLLPLLFGIGFLFWDARSKIGWVHGFLGAVFIFAGILVNLQIHFREATQFNLTAYPGRARNDDDYLYIFSFRFKSKDYLYR